MFGTTDMPAYWRRQFGDPLTSPERYLANHWILSPGHAVVWCQAVLAFLATHVLGEPWQRPDLL
jgi:hypothetical protein